MSPVEVEDELLRTIDLMEINTVGGVDPVDGEVVASLTALARARIDAEAAYKAAHGTATLRAEGSSEGKRKANVETNKHVRQKWREAELAEAVHNNRKAYLDFLRHKLDALRTIAANMRGQV